VTCASAIQFDADIMARYYGLPLQTVELFNRTLDQVIAMRPEGEDIADACWLVADACGGDDVRRLPDARDGDAPDVTGVLN
jgi:hypothetical protein